MAEKPLSRKAAVAEAKSRTREADVAARTDGGRMARHRAGPEAGPRDHEGFLRLWPRRFLSWLSRACRGGCCLLAGGGDALLLEEGADAADGEADGGGVDAEQVAELRVGLCEAVVAGGGGDDGGEREQGRAAAVFAPGVPAVEVEALLADGLPWQGDGLQQGAEVVDAGFRGQGLQAGGR